MALDYGFKNGFVKDEEKTLKALAQYWHAAKELEKAKPAYAKAAEISEGIKLYPMSEKIYFSSYDMPPTLLRNLGSMPSDSLNIALEYVSVLSNHKEKNSFPKS